MTSELLALWPETDASLVRASLPSWRSSADTTVSHFATDVLGWNMPTVREVTSQFRVGNGVHAFAVRQRAGSPVMEVHAALTRKSAWSVTYLWGFGKTEPHASVSITPKVADVAFGYWGKAASAELLLVYGRHEIQRVSTSRARWSVRLTFPINVNGAVMVLFRDGDGNVYTGWGTTLHAGPLAAG